MILDLYYIFGFRGGRREKKFGPKVEKTGGQRKLFSWKDKGEARWPVPSDRRKSFRKI